MCPVEILPAGLCREGADDLASAEYKSFFRFTGITKSLPKFYLQRHSLSPNLRVVGSSGGGLL